MSSFSYLLATDTFDADAEADVLRDGTEQLADALYCVPALWLALLAADGPRLIDEDNVLFAAEREAAIARLLRRAPRLAGWMHSPHVQGYVEHFAEMMREESAAYLLIDASEIALMDEPDVLIAQVDAIVAWLDGDDSADGPASIKRLCGVMAGMELPAPVEGLEDAASAAAWKRVIALLGNGDAWW